VQKTVSSAISAGLEMWEDKKPVAIVLGHVTLFVAVVAVLHSQGHRLAV
jgi:hypothetical protein